MLEFALPLALMMQPVTTPSDLPPAPPPAREEVDVRKLKKIYVKDSTKASRVEIQHPLQQVCVRKPVVGSRVKVRTVCQDQASWKAYLLARDAAADEWGNARQGVVVE